MTRKNKILIVDDHEETRRMYAGTFADAGFDVLEAKDGVEGLDIVTSEEGVNIVFTGIIMPRMDGFQLVESMKENTSTAEIPVVVNSHLGREEDRQKMSALGAKDFIVKGVTPPAEAVRRVKKILNLGTYQIKIDPYDLDGQKFITDFNMPEDMKCRNCGSELAFRVQYGKDDKLMSRVNCPNCDEKY